MEWQDERTQWSWAGKPITLGMTAYGRGPTVLLLPALSSISTRREMRPLQERLGGAFHTVAVDWPGFGVLPKPKIAWTPEAYRAFLRQIAARFKPAATVAAGHAASYAIAQAAEAPGSLGALSLISPTWRGPLPTMAGKRMPIFRRIGQAVDLPVIGPLLYRLNVNRPVIGMMARGHVYADPAWLTETRLREKLAVTEAEGARHASFRFVTGELDLYHAREAFLADASKIKTPVQVVYAKTMPKRSKGELAALAALPGVTSVELPEGKLSVYEEHPELVAPAVAAFLKANLSGRPEPGAD
jgi:pimeloyl-ACP methyl ester carboxylesterase